MTSAIARVSLARIVRMRRGYAVLGWAAVAIAIAIAARLRGDVNGADHTLRGALSYFVLPLMTYAVVSATFGGTGLRASVRAVVLLGASPARAVRTSVLVAIAAAAAVSGIVAAIVCVVAHGAADPSLAADLAASSGIAVVGGAAYGAYFSAGSAFRSNAMRGVFLAADWILGAQGGFGAFFTPRGHLASLFGGAACFELSRRASSIVLVLLVLFYFAIALRVVRRQLSS